MPAPLTPSRYIPVILRKLPFQMLDDWKETVSTLRHALWTIRNIRWSRSIPHAIVFVLSLVAGYRLVVDENNLSGGCNCNIYSTWAKPIALEGELLTHLYHDGTGRVDYASWGAGGRIIRELTSDTHGDAVYPTSWYRRWFIGPSDQSSKYHPPEYAINPDTHLGSCWPMRGRNGTLGISLARPVMIGSFTIDHVPSRMAINPHSAPRSGELWGALQRGEKLNSLARNAPGLRFSNFSSILPGSTSQPHIPSFASHDFVLLGKFTRQLDHNLPFQTFYLPRNTTEVLGEMVFTVVVIVIRENWGENDYTCLYRVRVHEL